MSERWSRLADLAVHGANVQRGQIVAVSAAHGQAELARAVAEAAYRRGAKFVELGYYDPYGKRARVRHADPDTLDFVPSWYGERLLELGDNLAARISLAGVSTPNLFEDLDPALVGKDRLPWLKEVSKLIADRSTNWSIVPCPHVEWAKLVYPDLPEDEAYERLWREVEYVLRFDADDPNAAWDERMEALKDSADRGSVHDAGSGAHGGHGHVDEAARATGRNDHSRPPRPLRRRERRRGRGRRGRCGAPLAARRGRRGPSSRRARAGRQRGPDRAARHDLLRHAAG